MSDSTRLMSYATFLHFMTSSYTFSAGRGIAEVLSCPPDECDGDGSVVVVGSIERDPCAVSTRPL